MKILFVTYNFQPEPNFFFGLPFAKELTRRGHQVQILTTFPNYPHGNIYEGYKNHFIFRETMEGIPVVRVPLYPSHDASSFKRILSYTSFALSASAIGTFAIDKADVAYVVQGPATNGLPAIIIKLLRQIPFVFDIKDLWPDSLTATGMFNNKTGLWLVDKWCKLCYKTASKIVVPTAGIKEKIIQRGVPDKKVELIYNWCDDSQITFEKPDAYLAKAIGFESKFNIVFAGNMGKAQALNKVIEAARIVYNKSDAIQFVFIGDGIEVENLKKLAENLKLKNVLFIPRQPVSEIGKILSIADVLFVHLKDDPLFRITIPSKVQAYMAAGKPILVGLKGDASELVESIGAGIICTPENAENIACSALKLYEMSKDQLKEMGEKGKSFYHDKMSFSVAVEKYENIFNSIKLNK